MTTTSPLDVLNNTTHTHIKRRCHQLNQSAQPLPVGRKQNKTHVFAGQSRCALTVRPLRDMCLDKLRRQLPRLVTNDTVDYHTVLRPLLERCSADELRRLESLCPSLVTLTDDLWHLLCDNEFHYTVANDQTDGTVDNQLYRNSVPNKASVETWRHFYWRSMADRKRRIDDISATIRQKSQCIKTSIKTTKVCELEPKMLVPEVKASAVAELAAKKRPIKTAPLMRKCLQMRKQKFML